MELAYHGRGNTLWISCRRRQLGVIIFVARRCSVFFDVEDEAEGRTAIEIIAMKSLAAQEA